MQLINSADWIVKTIQRIQQLNGKILRRKSLWNEYFSRWYDKDPVLSMSMRTLSSSGRVASQIAVAHEFD